MELWTEYEGRTIDGVFPLAKLLSPEGRSAFFSTVNQKGVPTVIRLIESHFDEDEILARWRKVTALNHPNLLKLEQHGQIVLDETPVIYAVMEPTEANLGDVLSQQRLIVSEAKQLASNLLAAIEALHTAGFIHEHVAAANVFAVGEVVKLRSDCIRETPAGEEGAELKKRDLQALAIVLLQALTQQQTLEAAASDLPLPAPFEQIVRKGISGEWGKAEIRAALEAKEHPPEAPPIPRSVASSPAAPAPLPPPPPIEAPPADRFPPPRRERIPDADRKAGVLGTGWMIALGLVLILVLWLGWRALQKKPANPATAPNAPQAATSKPAPALKNSAATPAPQVSPVPKPAPKAAPHKDVATDRGQWRVIAYKYNLESNAQKKAAAIAAKHPELHPKVFSPTGHTPYFIMIGGTMNREEAYALAKKAPQKGLPHETYAQEIRGR